MSSPPSPVGDAVLQLCARPGGMRNDAATRALIVAMTGKPEIPSWSISPRLYKFIQRGLVDADTRGRHGRHSATYIITAKGRHYLATPREARYDTHARKRGAKPFLAVATLPARKAANVQTVGKALGYDKRIQCSPEEAERLRHTGYYSSGAYRTDGVDIDAAHRRGAGT